MSGGCRIHHHDESFAQNESGGLQAEDRNGRGSRCFNPVERRWRDVDLWVARPRRNSGRGRGTKYEQESAGYYGVLLGGRPELLAELPAVYDSPILGHGSWAREPLYIIEQRQALLLLGYRRLH